MNYFIIVVIAVTGLYLHWWIYWHIRRWMDRDLALLFADGDPQKRDYLLQQLAEAKVGRVKRRNLPAWLERTAVNYPSHEA